MYRQLDLKDDGCMSRGFFQNCKHRRYRNIIAKLDLQDRYLLTTSPQIAREYTTHFGNYSAKLEHFVCYIY